MCERLLPSPELIVVVFHLARCDGALSEAYDHLSGHLILSSFTLVKEHLALYGVALVTFESIPRTPTSRTLLS